MPDKINLLFNALESNAPIRQNKEIVESLKDINLNALYKRTISYSNSKYEKVQQRTFNLPPLLSAMILTYENEGNKLPGKNQKISSNSTYNHKQHKIDNVKILIENGAIVDTLQQGQNEFKLTFLPYRNNSYQIEMKTSKSQEKIVFGENDPLLYNATELAKLLISNGAKNLNLDIRATTNNDKINFLVDAYTPLAISQQRLYNDYEQLKNKNPTSLKVDDVWPVILGFNSAPPKELKLNFIESFNVSEEDSKTIHNLIIEKIKKMTPEEKAKEGSYVISDSKTPIDIFSVINENLLLKLDPNQLILPTETFNREKFMHEFTKVYKIRFDNKAKTLSDPDNIKQAAKWCNAVVGTINQEPGITIKDIKYISSIILLCAAMDPNEAQNKLNLFAKDPKKVPVHLQEALKNIIGEVNCKRPRRKL